MVSIHEILCYNPGAWHVLCPESKEATIPYDTLLDLAITAIRQFIPSSLSNPPRPAQKLEHLLEDHYQKEKELYRSLYYAVDGKLLTSPKYVVKQGKNGRAINFTSSLSNGE